MNNVIFIIHSSAIVCHGLAEMLRRHFKGSIHSFDDLVSLQKRWEKLPGNSIVFIEEQFGFGTEFFDFQHHNSTVRYVKICNNKSLLISDFDGMRLCVFDSGDEVHGQIEQILEQMIMDEETEGLSDRELDVLKLVAVGFSNKEIAEKLFISIHTVMSHRKNITEKLGIKSISGLTVYAIINNHLDTTNLNIKDLI